MKKSTNNKTTKLLLILVIMVVSCKSDGDEINLDDKSLDEEEINLVDSLDKDSVADDNFFSYIETEFMVDYYGPSSIWIYEGGNVRTLPINPGTGSPDIQWIDNDLYYLASSGIVKYNLETNQITEIAPLNPFGTNTFKISPDRSIMAYSDFEDIILMNLNDGTTQNVTSGREGEFRIPVWSPNGKQLLIRNGIPKYREGDLYPTATGNYKVYFLESGDFQDVEMFDEFAAPNSASWSPDGQTVVYSQYSAIFTFNLNSETLRRFTPKEVAATRPKFSPNGKMISYLSTDLSDGDSVRTNFLTIYDLDSETSQVANANYSQNVTWNTDGNRIIYSTYQGISSYDLMTSEIMLLVEAKESFIIRNIKWIN